MTSLDVFHEVRTSADVFEEMMASSNIRDDRMTFPDASYVMNITERHGTKCEERKESLTVGKERTSYRTSVIRCWHVQDKVPGHL